MRLLVAVVFSFVYANAAQDRFNFDKTQGNDFGPKDWNKVTCTNHKKCPGYPDDWESYNPYIPYKESKNACKDCAVRTGGVCKRHKQSPIHLYRNVTRNRECKDRHWMSYKRGTCGFGDMKFRIERHTLRAYQPLNAQAQSTCAKPSNIDFSFGFPRRWHLVHTDISVPSNHMQDGKLYDAEVVLAHIYSVKKYDRLIGKVSIFLEAGKESDKYSFLESYINRWKRTAKSVKNKCARRRELGLYNETMDDVAEEDLYPLSYRNTEENADSEERLLQQQKFHPYNWIKKVQTEYYFRYEGSQGVPPCLEAVHWRVMKDPIKVAPSQIQDLEQLMATRLNPTTCKPDHAGRLGKDGKVRFNRPIQTTTDAHKVVFCECVDWPSKQEKDLNWCKRSMKDRGVRPLKK